LNIFLFVVFGIAAQLRCTKVLCDNNELTTLYHYKIGGLRANAPRETTKGWLRGVHLPRGHYRILFAM